MPVDVEFVAAYRDHDTEGFAHRIRPYRPGLTPWMA
jgi:hypothetical protein